jgi:hypothetical protein
VDALGAGEQVGTLSASTETKLSSFYPQNGTFHHFIYLWIKDMTINSVYVGFV